MNCIYYLYRFDDKKIKHDDCFWENKIKSQLKKNLYRKHVASISE
jgi:hypothetical protein